MKVKFGTDGVRGAYGDEITEALATALGWAAVRVLGPRLALARDTRPSGASLASAWAAGAAMAGGEVQDLGVLPTPGLSALVVELGLDGGAMITASHNPAADNGVKLVDRRGEKIDAAARTAVEASVAEGPPPLAGGRLDRPTDAGDRYVRAVLAALPRGAWLKGRTLVVDTANGAARGLAGRVVEGLGGRVIPRGDGDGARINDGCGALHPEGLIVAVRDAGADAGVALDGDGDRGVAVLSDGTVLDGDAILWLCAEGDVVVGTIMSNGGLERGLLERGVRLERAAVGDANVAARMVQTGARVGGEPSGHVLFSDALPTADGLVTALRALHPDPRGVSARLAGFVRDPQLHAAVRVPGDRVKGVAGMIEALRGEGARVVVRASGTEPVVRVMVEHPDAAFAADAVRRLVAGLQA
jgi:phosphoglucosamine mutase